MTLRSSSVSLPHFSLTLPLTCFQFPSMRFESMHDSLALSDVCTNGVSKASTTSHFIRSRVTSFCKATGLQSPHQDRPDSLIVVSVDQGRPKFVLSTRGQRR